MYDIEVKNEQVIDGEKGTVAEKAVGSFDIKNGKVYIRYKTSDESASVSTTIIAGEGRVTVKRAGDISSVMEYVTGKTTRFLYRMPYGTAEMEIYTKTLKAEFDENGGELKINCVLTTCGETYGNNIIVRVKGR